jgi:hypothetical protein
MDQKILQELQEIKAVLSNVVTKDDAKNFVTKDDAKNFATKDDLAQQTEQIIASVAEINSDVFDEIDKQKADRGDVTFLTKRVREIEKKLAS